MFDVGFWELALIGVIALIVVGPDRLPGMARTVGFWIGRARRYVDQVRRDVEREIHAEELRNAIHGKDGLDDLYQAVDETRSAVREIESDFKAATDDDADRGAQAKAPQADATGVGDPGTDDARADEHERGTDETRAGGARTSEIGGNEAGANEAGTNETGTPSETAEAAGEGAGETVPARPGAQSEATLEPAGGETAPDGSGSEPASGERAGSWTEGIRGPVEDLPGTEPATSSAADAEPEPRRDERRETHG